jgi:competence ComEA-like helix-hairpin-helix protein
MAHQNLLIGMIGFLIAGAGGVFVLLNQGGQPVSNAHITKEALVAGISVQEEDRVGEFVKTEERAAEKPKEPASAAPQLVPVPKKPSPVPLPVPEPSVIPEAEISEVAVADPEPVPVPVVESTPSQQPVGRININTANSGELQQLNGIGPVLAGRIIDYRKNISLFYAIEDIKNVKGIGEVIFGKTRDNIIVGNVSPPAPQPSPPAPTPSSTPTPSQTPPSSSKININTANYEELQGITGVGPSIAKNIIDYRNANGPFAQIEDIMNVPLIAEGRFEKMKEEITI